MNLVPELFLLFLLFTEGWSKGNDTTQNEINKCVGLRTPGYTVPNGDIILEYGQSLNITCNLYEHEARNWKTLNEGYPSSRLYFFRNGINIYPNNEYDPGDPTMERVEIVNETSIRLNIDKPDKTKWDNVFCYFNESMDKKGQQTVCTNVVVVGVPPQNVTKFSCVSENYERLVCTWTAPENYALTEYELSYYFKPYHNLISPSPCPEYPIYDNLSKSMNCTWTILTTPQYRQSKDIYWFTLRMSNSLGNLTQEFEFDHYKRMHPKKVEDLTVVATSSHSIRLSWSYNSKLDGFPKPLEGKILYKSESCNQSWHLGGTFFSNTTSYDLLDLPYAHALYEIRIRIKPVEADDTMWSEPANVFRRTDSKRPERPPRVTVGSFQTINIGNSEMHRDVFVYFQQLKECEKNGENFTYEVDSIPKAQLIELTKTYAKFEKLDGREYTIQVWSKNEIGRSLLSSRVVIPSRPMNEPEQFLKIERSSDTYELEWEKPKSEQTVTNYTIFWCINERDRPHQCVGYLDWTIVSSDTFRFNITLQNHTIYQFAIAANSHNSSSGMRWAECTVLPNRTVGKIRNVWVNQVGSDFMELTWKLDCSDILSKVIGYVIYYCTTTSLTGTTCEGPLKSITIDGNLSVQSARVTNLTPYTTYLLAVSVKSTIALSQPSDYLRNVTSESAPSTPPLNVTITKVTNSSIDITWLPPKVLNGAIKHYLIVYNDVVKKVDSKKSREVLTDLESYKKYTIYMQACTTECSRSSENQTVVTKMGTPAKIDRPFTIVSNETVNIIGWNKPSPPRGELNYYQLSITHDGVDVDNGEISNFTNAENYTIENCRENAQYHSLYVSLRAVNIIDGEHYPGSWSDTIKIYCYQTSWYLVIYVIIAIGVFSGLVYGGRKLYILWKIARRVEIKLPPGLEPAVEHSEKNPVITDRKFIHDPDEELLLERMAEKGQIGDSSGCSSGQESITSSVDSTHLSTDSGTDQTRNVTDDNKENSLRLRNVSTKAFSGYVMHDPTPVVNRGTKPAPAPAGSYCLIGVDPSSKPIQDNLYTTISEIDHSLPQYVATDPPPPLPPRYIMTDIFKTPNPGYVPFAPKEPPSKNTGYVVAGDLTSAPTSEPKSDYMVVDTNVGLKPATVWQQPLVEPSLTKPGYVSVGDAPPPIAVNEAKGGYVPHRQFESKALKED